MSQKESLRVKRKTRPIKKRHLLRVSNILQMFGTRNGEIAVIRGGRTVVRVLPERV